MAVSVKDFGKGTGGADVKLYSISNSKGMQADVTDQGAILVDLFVPTKDGVKDVVLGFDTVDNYLPNPCFFGATIGPNANRIGGAQFELDGVVYDLEVNDNKNNLHSHAKLGYDKRVWDAKVGENSVEFSLEDPATLGFPGNKEIKVTYEVTEDNELKIHYQGKSDARTIINMTNHSYFNLNGAGSGNIEDHYIKIESSHYTLGDAELIPTGEIASVEGTPFDLRTLTRVGDHIDDDNEQLAAGKGYDHNYCIDGWDGTQRLAATVESKESGLVMKVYTDLPGIQFYAGNCIDIGDMLGKGGVPYGKRAGLCLETQFYPDFIHHENFPQGIFGEGKDLDSVTVYAFE